MKELGTSILKWSLLVLLICALPLIFMLVMAPQGANPAGAGVLFLVVSSFSGLTVPASLIMIAVGSRN
jgi:FtsH-binding integral membrane protein